MMTSEQRLESLHSLAVATQLQGGYYVPDKNMEYRTGYRATIYLADRPEQSHRRYAVIDLETGKVTHCQLSLTDWYADDAPNKTDIQTLDRRIRYLLKETT